MRFEQRLGFVIDPETEYFIIEAVEQEVFERINRQRLIQEIRLIQQEGDMISSKIIKRLSALGVRMEVKDG